MIEISEQSSASSQDLWEYLGDVERWGDHLPTFDSVRHVGGPSPTAVGSRFEVRQPGLAKATYEITRWEPGRGFTWVGRVPGVATTGIHDLESDDTGTRIRLGMEWSGPLAWAIRLLMTAKARRMIQSEGKTLSQLAEED